MAAAGHAYGMARAAPGITSKILDLESSFWYERHIFLTESLNSYIKVIGQGQGQGPTNRKRVCNAVPTTNLRLTYTNFMFDIPVHIRDI